MSAASPKQRPLSVAHFLRGFVSDILGVGGLGFLVEPGRYASPRPRERFLFPDGLPAPRESFEFCGKRFSKRLVVLRPRKGLLFRRPKVGGSARLRSLVEAGEGSAEDLQLVPVAIYWGRSPDREDSAFKLLFAENWEMAGRMRKFFATVLHGRNTLMRFSHALPLNSIIQEKLDPEIAFRKVSRILRVHFRKRRTATVGPDLSNRRRIARLVALAPNVKRAVAAEAGDDPKSRAAAERKVQQYVMEIAADVSYPAIRIAVRVLRRLWHQIYDGIELNHVDTLHEVANKKEVVYVPCHRSHFDYLLLGWVTYQEGLQLPHIAAGINLNLPIVGGILRRGGAFFLRRTFKGNRLYAAVFDAYIQEVLSKGHSMEYFIEGGRSRTGRLLAPKGGMLAMTVGSYIQNPRRPIVFVPVYFGYEKLIEGQAFISELGGAAKEKESLGGLVRSVKSLRDHFGKVWVNFGEPIYLDPILERHRPDWRSNKPSNGERPPWIGGIVDELGGTIMKNNIAVDIIGRRYGIPGSVQREMDKTIELSRANAGLRLCLAINYGGRAEIAEIVGESRAPLDSGAIRELTIAPEMGYGQRGAGDVIPPGAVLVFEVELLKLTGAGD